MRLLRHNSMGEVGTKTMHIEIGPSQPLAPRDTIIVASDGLFDNLQSDEIIHRACPGKLHERVCRLTELAINRMGGVDDSHPGKPDDLTVLALTR